MGADDKKPRIKILQVSNISVTASKDQIYTMLQYIGRIDDIKIYPTDINITSSTTQKVAFVKYDDDRSVEVGQHLTNTVLIDRAVVCTPWPQPTIPDESTFMNSGGVTMAGQRQLPPHVSNKTQVDADGVSMLLTVDPTLEQLGLPSYPLLPGDTDLAKVEEIRRTVYVGNLPKGTEGQTVSDFFNSYIGEVMYVRMAAGPETLPCAYAYVEFSQQTTVPIALQNSGIEFQGRLLKIQHSRVAIIKPQQKTADQALEEVEEAIRMGKTGDAPPAAASASRRSRTRSPRRRRSRSRDKERERSRRRSKSKEKKRSRSREKKRSRSRERDTKRRSRSRDRRARRSRSRDRRERSKSRDRKRSRSKSRDRKRSRSRDRKRERDRKERRRSRSRSKDRSDRKKDRRDRSSDRRRSTKDKERKEKDVDKQSVEDKEEKLRDKLLEKAAARNGNTDGSTSDLDMEDQKVDKKPSKIKNERKRHLSDSD